MKNKKLGKRFEDNKVDSIHVTARDGKFLTSIDSVGMQEHANFSISTSQAIAHVTQRPSCPKSKC